MPYVFSPPAQLPPGGWYRFDTASGSDSPAAILSASGGSQLDAVQQVNSAGRLPRVSTAGTPTLYLKQLDYRGKGGAVVPGSAVELVGALQGGGGVGGGYSPPAGGIPISDLKRSDLDATYRQYAPSLLKVPGRVYGHSYTATGAGVQWTTGAGFWDRIAAEHGSTITSYGVGSSRMAEVMYDTIYAGIRSGTSAGQWVAGTQGFAVIDCLVNDMRNLKSNGTFAPTDLTATRLANYATCLRGALAVLSASSRVELESGTTSGTWTNKTPAAFSSGNAFLETAEQGAYKEVTITLTSAGVAYVMGIENGSGARGIATVSLDGVDVGSSAGGIAVENVYSGRGGGTQLVDLAPWIVKVTGTPGTHTLRVRKSDASSNVVHLDAVYVQSPTPPSVFVLLDPATKAGADSASVAAGVATARPQWLTTIAGVLPEFPHAVSVDLAPIATNGLSSDGIHPNDIGQNMIADMIVSAARAVGFRAGLNKL